MESEEINDIKIIDEDGLDLPWSHVFFTLHKHCNLDKSTIMDYTLPQILDLMESSNKYIEFELSSKMPFMPMMGGSMEQGGDGEFTEATEEDINELAKFLGG